MTAITDLSLRIKAYLSLKTNDLPTHWHMQTDTSTHYTTKMKFPIIANMRLLQGATGYSILWSAYKKCTYMLIDEIDHQKRS